MTAKHSRSVTLYRVCEVEYAILAIDLLQQHCADASVACVRLHDELRFKAGPGEHRGRGYQRFNPLKSFLLLLIHSGDLSP